MHLNGSKLFVSLVLLSFAQLALGQTGAQKSGETKGASLSGVLVDRSTQKPLEGAQVTLRGGKPESAGVTLWKHTDEQGRFAFTDNLNPGTYSLSFAGIKINGPGGGSPLTLAIKAGDSARHLGQLLVDAPAVDITGVLVGKGKMEPVTPKTLWLVVRKQDASGSTEWLLTGDYVSYTDKSGRFRFRFVPPGTYGLMSGLDPETVTDGRQGVIVEVKAGQSGTVDLGKVFDSR
jgi:hypothetical protein